MGPNKQTAKKKNMCIHVCHAFTYSFPVTAIWENSQNGEGHGYLVAVTGSTGQLRDVLDCDRVYVATFQ